MTTQHRAVAVIGASAAGLLTARELAMHGLNVTVFEASDSINPASRSLIVTHRMRDFVGTLADRAVVNEIRHFELFANGRVATVTLTEPDLVVERATLIRHLVNEVVNAGAQLALSRRLQSIQGTGSGATLQFQRIGAEIEEVPVNTVVGADGTFSRVARAAGWPRQPTASLVQAKVRLPPDLRPDTTRVWFIPNDTPYFYWLIPDSNGQGVLGLIGQDGEETYRCLVRFLSKQNLKPLVFQAARIPAYNGWVPLRRRVGNADVYVVGDAGGHVKVTTVGGLVTGFRAARCVAESIVNGRLSLQALTLKWELDVHLLIRKVLHRFNQDDYCRLFDVLDSASWHLLGTYTRDEVPRLLMRLCLTQPRLFLMGLRGALLSPTRTGL